MITVPSQEITAFLGSHLDHALHRTGTNPLSSVAADCEFQAGCAIMDDLNAVESAQEFLRQLLANKAGESRPFEVLERLVTSVDLNGRGEGLATKTPSELIALAQKVESKPVNIRMLDDFLPDVPIEDQVQVGLE
ncbi:hypothetical protein BGZ83_001696 [Gryganskiella cystojenkinii]|nr:hypothetical protein BGZ83_001696 [Gryganskiella cystojenkinii]